MVYRFEAEIKLLEGKMKWNVVYFPHSVKEVFGTKGRVPVSITVDGYEFDHTLLPSRNGHYFVYNKIISRIVGKGRGETVQIMLKKTEGKRDIELPEYVRRKLVDSKTLDVFMDQPAYIQREQINHIIEAKRDDTRHARTEKLIKRLGEV